MNKELQIEAKRRNVSGPLLRSGNTKLNSRFFREGSRFDVSVQDFEMARGGLGDLLGYMSAIVWTAKNHSQIAGRVYCNKFFAPVARNILNPFKKWQVHEFKGTPPPNGIVSADGTSITSISEGIHMIDYGFLKYLEMNPPPIDGNFAPELDLSKIEMPDLPERYAVMTPGYNIDGLRKMPDSAFNGVKDYLISKGVTPVFIGSAKEVSGNWAFMDEGELPTEFSKGYNYEGGIDLRNKTSILEAAKIIQGARCILGLDNGLLHLAACTGSVPIVFGYNLVAPEHRRPRRREGKVFEVHPTFEQLSCTFCRSRMRGINDMQAHSGCVYGDKECLTLLADPRIWTQKVEMALG